MSNRQFVVCFILYFNFIVKKKLQSWTESMNEMGNFRQILKTTSNWKAILEKVLRASDLLESLELYDLRS